MSKHLKFIDLFCGCGGFSKGLEMAGHQCLLGVDFDRDAIETFKNNHQWAETFHDDIANLTQAKLNALIGHTKIDMVIGGPPCQGFSTIGRGDTQDMRNKLFLEFVRIVKMLNPKIIMFENVTGIIAKKNQAILKAIFRSFERLGYLMDARILSSEEYGVPEKRRRAVIMGCRDELIPEFPPITHGGRGKYPLVTVADVLFSLQSEKGELSNHNIGTAQIKSELDRKRLAYIPEGKGIRYQRDEEMYLPKSLRYGVNWKELSENRFRQMRLQRLERNSPAPTILTNKAAYCHPLEIRHLTTREAAACQSFPNNFVFSGSLTAQFRQIGNAVPPVLAKIIGKQLSKIFKKKRKTKKIPANNNFGKNAFTYTSQTIA